MTVNNINSLQLMNTIHQWAQELGFSRLGISGVDLSADEPWLLQYLEAGYHGEMEFLPRHGTLRSRPAELLPGTLRVISLCMDYLPADTAMAQQLTDKSMAYVSRYALGRDYHKLMRKRLQQLAERIQDTVTVLGYRVFVDSAPVLESALARNAGLGWIGKNTLLINRKAGSYFFLGEIFVDIPLPMDKTISSDHCGRCTACLERCPTQAFVGPYVLDARRCISYLTIEFKGSIPLALRPLIGNRVFGCDDCQLVCPWNRFAKFTAEEDFSPRHRLDNSRLAELFTWNEETFLSRTEGSPIRRAGYENWLRNLAVGLGNAPTTIPVVEALRTRQHHSSALVREHVCWALQRHGAE